MAKLAYSAIRTFQMAIGQWVPIPAPINCNSWALINQSDGSEIYRCSDTLDSTTEYEMPAASGFSHNIPRPAFGFAPPLPYNLGTYRYQIGDNVTFLMGTTNCTVQVEFYI